MTDLEFRMLGPFEVLRRGAPLPLGPGRPRALLALLLVHAGEVVSADHLMEELWRGDPPSSAAHALQVYVSQLRKLLGQEAGILVTQRPGYMLAAPPERCDASRFEVLVAEGRSLLGQQRAADASGVLDQALSLWRGPVLADLPDQPSVQAEATRLSELRHVATEWRIEAELALGHHGEQVSELEGLVRRHPLRERLWAHLMVALYRAGRQADALRAYQRLREVLGEELGLEPSPELRHLEAAVLRHDPELATPAVEPAEAVGPVEAVEAVEVPAPRSVAHDAAIEEVRVVTALFADLVGSTPLAEQLSPEELTLIVNGAVDRMAGCAEALGGTIGSRLGDGILALFGVREAHEDDPERAVRAGLRMVTEVAAYGEEVAHSWDVEPLQARVGIDIGAVVVGGPADQQVLGDALNTASRLQGAARPGSVLVSDAVRHLVDPLFDWSDRPQLALKGKAEDVGAAEALAARAVPGKVRGLEGRRLPIIGREPELAVATRSLDSLLAGTGGVLVVTGEAGTGKSRLLAELRQRVEESPSVGRLPVWLDGRCLSWGGSLTYGPFRELLREWLGASPTHPAMRTRVALRRRVDELFGADASDVSALLATVLGVPLEPEASERLSSLPPETLRLAVFDAVRSLLGRLAADGPVVVALDDLHWADATSLLLLAHLLPATETAAVLLVVAARPERDHGWWRIREAAQRELAHRTREVILEALTAGAGSDMLDELLGRGTLPPATARELLEAADGNPLFIEELVRSLVDAGALRHGPAGWEFERAVPIEIPRTVESVLASRIDRLPAAGRAVLGAAAVLGRQFDLGVLAELCVETADLEGVLGELQQAELLQQARRWPSVEYRFCHPLIQEAAYRRLVTDRRRELHRRAAHALETRGPDRLAQSYGILAFHCEQAGETERALEYHRLAAEAARRAHALDEVDRHCTAALELTASVLPERARVERPPLHLLRGYAWWQLADERAGDELRRALESARAVGDTASELGALEALASVEGLAEGHQSRAIARLEEALAVARRLGDLAAEVSVRNRLTVVLVNRLELGGALESGEAALATARRTADEMLAARAMDGLKLVAFVLGDYPRLEELAGELQDSLRRHDDRWYLQYLLAESSYAAAASGDWEGAFGRLGEAKAINEGLGDQYTAPYLLTLSAWLERTRGRYGAALAAGHAAAAGARAGGNIQWIAWSEANLGAILVELGAAGEALDHLEAARSAAERGGIRIQAVRAAAHLALARLTAGDPAVVGELESAEELLASVRLPPGRHFLYGLDAYLAVAEVRMAEGETDAVVERISPLLVAAGAARWGEGVARTSLVCGRCSAQRGDAETAAGLLEQALETAAGSGLPPVEWQARAALAALLRQQGDGTGAGEHETLARALVDGLGVSIEDPSLRASFAAAALARLQDRRP